MCWGVLYFFFDKLGKLMSVIGAATGLVLIYFIPLVVNMVYYQVKHPEEKKREEILIKDETQENRITLNTNVYSEILMGPHIISTKTPSKIKDVFFYISQYALMAYGIFTLVIQFVTINFFNIHFQN